MQLIQLVYQSRATVPLAADELQQLLGHWRRHNQREHISGLLLYGDEDIVQVLEGPAPAVHRLYATIAADARHHDVLTLADGRVRQRAFADWSMGFAWFEPALRQHLAGYVGRPDAPGSLPDEPRAWPELTAMLRDFVSQQQPVLQEKL